MLQFQNMNFCFLNSQIIPINEAKISPLDIGILRGFGIYEGIAAFSGEPFRFADHWGRFVKSAQAFNLNIPITEEKALKVIKELLSKNNHTLRANIRMILTGGEAINGIEYNFESPTFYILTENHTPLESEIYQSGGRLVTYNFKRQFPEFKTTNYINAVNLQEFRKAEEAVEVLYTNEGEVLECATSNIFLVKDGKISTPAEGVLFGITRKVVLEIAPETEERIIEESELSAADEIFITSSFKDIVPITKVDDFVIGNGRLGAKTLDLMAKFKACTE
jgi:branched-chain amino acid aminotransferase